MGKPRLIILIRHAQSEGNKNRDIHQTTPDHRVKLTTEGKRQALEAGRKLRSLLHPDDTLHFFTSPYRRTRETTEGMLQALTSDDPEPSPFPRHTIKVFEEPRLREQDFGNFQPDSAEMTRMWHERAEYGHFFYRIPNGESAADAYDRISGFNESLWRMFNQDDFASVCVLVTHGLMTRVFLMKWYHWSVEYFEDLRNMNHCEFVVMQKNETNGKYMLKNRLRTWTQWRREQDEEQQKRRATIDTPAIPVRTKWAAKSDLDPSGFDHRKRERQNTADLFQDDGGNNVEKLTSALEAQNLNVEKQISKTSSPLKQERKASVDREVSPHHTNTNEEQESSAETPHEPPIYQSKRLEILQSGRDGGGTLSGRASRAGSEAEEPSTPFNAQTAAISKAEHLNEEERTKQFRPPTSMRLALAGAFNSDGSTRKVAMADALGDQSDMSDDEEAEMEDNVKEERAAEQSFGGSVR